MPNQTNIATELEYLKQNLDDFYVITNGIFLSLMQCGFGCLEVGAVRTKNAANIIMKNLLDLVVSCFVYYLVGYAFAYGEGNSFIGYTYFLGVGLPLQSNVNWFYQFIFAATSATIVSGAVAERCNFVAYLVYSAIISGVVYPIVTHWAWSTNGWLNTLGFKDFSGCGVVHALAGTAAFVAAAFLGPRKGRFDEKGKPQDLRGHSLAITGIGALLLFTGFLAFNGGALFHITQKGDSGIVAKSMINTVYAGTGGGLVCLVIGRLRLLDDSPWPFSYILNGTLAGMASSCAAPQKYAGWAMFIIGAIAAILYISLHRIVLYLKVDDPLDASPVHLAGGCWGMLAEGIFNPEGVYQGNGMKIVYDLTGLVAIMTWSTVWSIFIFGGLKYAGLLRVTEHEEIEGLDYPEHGVVAYPRAAWGEDGFFRTTGPPTANNKQGMNKNELYPAKNTEQEEPVFQREPRFIWNI